MPTKPDDVGIPALLRAARGAYGHAISVRLAAAGFDDVPRNGSYVLGGIVNHGGQAADLVRQLGVSKQAASQLIDTLVIRGYLQRAPHPDDGRRITISATECGKAAAAAIRSGVLSVDEQLATVISPAELAGMRAGLVALCDIRDQAEDHARGSE
jgi:DNA-binding MarR family transcriptional regulator